MASWRFPGWSALVQALARAISWLTDLVAIVVLGYIAQGWPETGGAVAPGLMGAAVALLTDSWQAVALVNRTLGLPLMSAARTVVHDMFALCVSAGGVVLIMLLGVRGDDDDWEGPPSVRLGGFGAAGSREYARGTVVEAAMWCLVAIVIWRFLFSFWACWDCYWDLNRQQRRRARRQEAW